MNVKLFLPVLFLLPFFSMAQLDSIHVQAQFEEIIYPSDTTEADTSIQLKVWVNDFDFFGEVIIDVLDELTEVPLAKVKYSHDEVIIENLIANNWITINIGPMNPTRSYILKTTVRNFQFLDLPQVVQTLHGIN